MEVVLDKDVRLIAPLVFFCYGITSGRHRYKGSERIYYHMECILCHNPVTTRFHEETDKRYGLRTYHRCSRCRLIFRDPTQFLGPIEERERYDSHINEPEDDGYVAFLRRLADPVLERLGPNAEGLDFGSGPGPAMHTIFSEHGHEIAHWDPFYDPDVRAFERQYDFIVSSETVEHFHHPDDDFLRMSRLLYDTNVLLGVMTEILLSESEFADWWYHRDPTHVCFYQRTTFEWIASWLGFSVEFPVRNVAIFMR